MNLFKKLIAIHLIIFTTFGFNYIHSRKPAPARAALVKSITAPKKIPDIVISKQPLCQVEIYNDTVYPVYLISKTAAGYAEIITIDVGETFSKNTEINSDLLYAKWRLVSFDQTKQVFLLCPIHHGPDEVWWTKRVLVSELLK